MCLRQASTLEAETRRYDEALAAAMDETLRASKESLSSVLEAKRAMHDRVKAAERRAIRAEHAAKQVLNLQLIVAGPVTCSLHVSKGHAITLIVTS
jgi:hypothetical protein